MPADNAVDSDAESGFGSNAENSFDPDTLHTIRQLKEKPGEVTELVQDTAGNRFIRKRWTDRSPKLAETYRALAGIHNPALPRIHSVREMPDGIEIIRTYVPGPTLRDWIGTRGPLPEPEARTLLAQVARGVRALHTCRPPIIHRDINPNNIIMGPDGPHLIDFGIARAFDPAANRDTHTWGTHGYAAPEQYGFGQSDARTDIFALGMVYWFLLTGTDPDANLSSQLTQMTLEEARQLGVSPSTREIIQECVTMAPERRFSNVDALVNALQAADAPASARAGNSQQAASAPEAAPVAPSDSAATHQPGEQRQQPIATGNRSIGRHGSSQRNATPGKLSRPIRTLFGKVWLVASTVFMALLVVGAIGYTVEPWRLAYPEALVRGGIAAFGVVLMVAPTWLVTANPFGFRDRLPYLREHRLRRCILLAVAGVIVGALLIIVVSEGLSPEYVQIMHQNGSTSV